MQKNLRNQTKSVIEELFVRHYDKARTNAERQEIIDAFDSLLREMRMTPKEEERKPYSSTPMVLIGSTAIPLAVVIGAMWMFIGVQKDTQIMAKDVLTIEKRICENEVLDQNQRAQIDKLTVVLEQIAVDMKEVKQNTRRQIGGTP